MPQYIEIAVVASCESILKSITTGVRIPDAEIMPRYFLVSLSTAMETRIYPFAEFDAQRVLLWIALDDNAEKVSEDTHRKNYMRPDYHRGFYNYLLPEPVIQVGSRQEFKNRVDEIYDAFCATS